ncbi:MAG: DUF1963 domain-containing protein [Neisseria sp.]|nr:DUF1963 domain-containing protein [Neisseria sp.]
MSPENLEQFFQSHPQYDKPQWRGLARPCIDIEITDAPPQPQESGFGGLPYALPGFVWPQHPHPQGYYRYLGQINFAELPDKAGLPEAGRLLLFYGEDAEGEVFWRDDDYILALYLAAGQECLHVAAPEHQRPHPPACKILLKKGLMLPASPYLDMDLPPDSDAFFDALYEFEEQGSDHMLGYPDHGSLAYDPTPGSGWLPLLNIGSHDRFEWCWHDADRLTVFVECEKAARGDFSTLKSDAG